MTENQEKLIEYLERLVLVKFRENERQRVLEEIEKILNFFKALDEVKELINYEPLFHVHDIEGPMREDEPRSDDLLTYRDLEINAILENGYIKAPKTVEE